MKKIIAIMILAGLSSSVFAAAVCAGSTTAVSGTVQAVTTTSFNVTEFTPKCSANVFLNVEQTALNVGVGSGSKKGKNVFAGNSGGGAVAPTGTTCPVSTGCTATETAAAATTALTAAGST